MSDLAITHPSDVAGMERLAERLGKTPALHVKVDSGMGRSGVLPAEAPGLIQAIRQSPKLRLAGVFTHFATADEEDKTHAQAQFEVFRGVLRAAGPLDGVLRHAANSAAIADMPQTVLDMVRPGIAVYGYQPSDDVLNRLPLRPCLRMTAPILQVKRLPAGATVGYSSLFKLARDSRVGIVPAGYADGISRHLSGHCPVGLGRDVVPVLGRVSMDQIIIDLTDHASAKVGDTAVLISPHPEDPHCVSNLARLAGTIPYEITCRIGRRVNFKAVADFGNLPG